MSFNRQKNFRVGPCRVHFAWRHVALFPMLDQGGAIDLAQLDVGSATRHVCGHHDRRELSSVAHNVGLALMLLCVEDLMLDARALAQHGA